MLGHYKHKGGFKCVWGLYRSFTKPLKSCTVASASDVKSAAITTTLGQPLVPPPPSQKKVCPPLNFSEQKKNTPANFRGRQFRSATTSWQLPDRLYYSVLGAQLLVSPHLTRGWVGVGRCKGDTPCRDQPQGLVLHNWLQGGQASSPSPFPSPGRRKLLRGAKRFGHSSARKFSEGSMR